MSQVDELKAYLQKFPDTEQVQIGTPVDMIEGRTLVNVIIIYKTRDEKPPDLNIHVTDSIKVEAHVK